MLNSSSRLVVETQCVLTPSLSPSLHSGDSPLIPDKDDFSCQRESPFSSSAHPKRRFSEVKLRCVGYWKGIPWQPASLGHLGLERHKDRNPKHQEEPVVLHNIIM